MKVRRRVEHVMGMPVSLALRGRHGGDARADAAWQAVLDDLRWVDKVFSTYREDSYVRRLDRGEVTLAECPPEVARVLELGRAAATASDHAFNIWRPGLDPSGARPRLLPVGRGGPAVPGCGRPRLAGRHRGPV